MRYKRKKLLVMVLFSAFIVPMFFLFTTKMVEATVQNSTINTLSAKNIKIVPEKADISTGETVKLSIEGYKGKITWVSSDPYIAEVDKSGLVTGRHKAGKVIITAKTSNKTFTCKIKNSTVMRDITAKQLVSEIKIGTNFASVLDYIDFNYKRGYNDYNNSSSEVGIMFTIWEPGKDYYYSDQGISMRKGDSIHQSIPLNSLNDCDSSLKLSSAVIQTGYSGNVDGKIIIKVSNAKITVGKTVYELKYLNGTHSMTMYAEQNTSSGIWNCGNSVGDKEKSGLPKLSKLVGGVFEADIKIVDLVEPNRVDKTTYYLTNEGMCSLPTKKMVDELKKEGYDAIRLTVSWTPHMNDSTFVIDKSWFNKVEEVVNWVLDNDMYVIINSHYDYLRRSWIKDRWSGVWMLPKYKDSVDSRYSAMWTQIANKFKNYDDYLIFEDMNEPYMSFDEYLSEGGEQDTFDAIQADRVNELNEIFYSVVRKSGGNNTERFLMLACVYEKTSHLSYLDLADKDKIIATAHTYYDPCEGVYTNGFDSLAGFEVLVDKDMERISAFIEKTGVPVIIGEFGNTEVIENKERIEQAIYLVKKAAEIGVPCFWWECAMSKGEAANTKYSLYNREEMKWAHKDILQAIISTAKANKE